MIDLIKSTSTKEKSSLKELFNAVPVQKSDWEYLEKELDDSREKQITSFANLNSINENYQATKKENALSKKEKIKQIKEQHHEQTNIIRDNFENQKNALIETFFNKQKELKQEIEEVENDYKIECAELDKKIVEINNSLKEGFFVLDNIIKEKRVEYLSKVSAIYNIKQTEIDRVTSKFHEQIQDYHQKNKQRLTQNTLKIQEEDALLKEYLKFHEKDEVYAKQNFLKTMTNLNDKVHIISTNYKQIEEQLENDFKEENDVLISELDKKKLEIDNLINEYLDNYEKEYQQIDAVLDSIREKHHNIEEKLKNKYDHKVTSINIHLHTEKDVIEAKITDLSDAPLENKKELSALNKKLNLLERDAKKQLRQTKKTYRKEFKKATSSYLSQYELNLLKRVLLEQDKNDAIDLYKELYSVEEGYANQLVRFAKSINNIKKEIVHNYLKLELLPLESQNELANNIYNTELKLQDIEDEYIYLKTSRTKQLANLKSELHKYNLNKTKDRVQYTYSLELTTSSLTNYLLMEAEKNELVYQNKLIQLQKNVHRALSEKEILLVKQEIARKTLKKKQHRNSFNFLLQSEIERKTLNMNLLTENNVFLLKKEDLLKGHSYNKLEHQELIQKFLVENTYLSDILAHYNEFYLMLFNDEKRILETFLVNSLKNTDINNFQVFLKTTKELLLLKNDLVATLGNDFFELIKGHTAKIISNFFLPKLDFYTVEIINHYDMYIEKPVNEKELLLRKVHNNNEQINTLNSSITELINKLNLSAETINYSKKELDSLRKLESTKKRKRLITDLNEHITINTKYQEERTQELKELKAKLNTHIKANKKANKQIKKIDLGLDKAEKQKERAIHLLNIFINKQIAVLTDLLNKFDHKNNIFINIINDYYHIVNASTTKHKTIRKTKKYLLKAFLRKKRFLYKLFDKLLVAKNKCIEDLTLNQLNNRKKQIHMQDLSLLRLERVHSKTNKKITLKIKRVGKKQAKELKKLNLKEAKETKLLRIKSIDELNIANKRIKDSEEAIPNYKQRYNDLKLAFEINKNDSLQKEHDSIKNTYRASLRENHKYIRETNNNIKRLMNDMDYEDKKHLAQTNYLLKKDRLNRKKILHKQTNARNYHDEQIYNLKRRMPKIDLEIRGVNARKQINETRIWRKLKKNTTKINFIKKLTLKFNIWNKTIQTMLDFTKALK